MRLSNLILLLILCQSFCIPFLSDKLDPNSDLSNLLFLYRINNRRAIAYTPSALVAYTNASATVTASPEDPNLTKCGTTSRLPEGVTMAENGNLSYTGLPTRTVNPIPMDIVCLDSANQYTSSAVDFEVRGYDWVRNLSVTNFNSPGRDVALSSDNEIHFFATTLNNGSNIAADFGQNVIKNSSPTPGTSNSPLIIKLDSEGNLLQSRILGGVGSQYGLKLTVDAQQNSYAISSLSLGVPLTINADPEFGGSPINKTPSNAGDNFLLSQIRSDGSFGYAISVASTATSRGTSICYNAKSNTILANGTASGTSQDLGIDFGVADLTTSTLGFQLEFTPEKTYVRSRKYLGTPTSAIVTNCKSDGSYTLGIQQSQLSFDYRIPYDGQSDIKTAISTIGGAAFSSIDSNGNYLFTKIFSSTIGQNTIPTGVARDSEGNYFFLFYSTGGDFDLRIGVDGVSDIKTFVAGSRGSYLVKLNPDGSYAWGKMIRGPVDITLDKLAIHPKRKSVFMVGSFVGTNREFFADFGVSLPLSSIPAASTMPVLVEVNTENGSLITARMLAESTINSASFTSMKFDSLGNLYLTGSLSGTSNFQYGTDGGIITKIHTYGTNIPQALFIKMRP
jgi:hypothetical protein